MRSYDAAELIVQALENHLDSGLSMPRLLEETDLKSGQYRAAYNWTLDNFEEPIWIKNYIGGEWIYLLPESARACMEDWRRTIKTQVTRARREHNKIHMIAKRHPTVSNRESALEAEYRLRKLQLERQRLGE